MKVLIANYDKFAHYYIHMGLAKAMTAMGIEVVMWDVNSKSVFDAFDEFEPDLFIGQSFNVNEAIIQCIKERPAMMVVMKGSDDGPIHDTMDHQKYPVLVASQKEKDTLQKLQDETGKPDFLFVHYDEHRLDETHGYWRKRGFRVESMLSAACVFDFTNGQKQPEFTSDIAFVGGRWGYKSATLDKWFLPVLESGLNIKIFGNQPWGVPQYCGFIADQHVKNLFASAKICPNLSEPHSQVFGYDIVERPFKLLSNKCFVISDYVEDLKKIIPDGIVYASTPVEFIEKIYYYLNKEDKRMDVAERGYRKVLSKHTYFHRVSHMFDKLGRPDLAEKALTTLAEIKDKLKL
jgi:hypothetical protein